MISVVRIRPKSTIIREAWQWTGQHPTKFPAWVPFVRTVEEDALLMHRRSGDIVINLNEWRVRDLDSTDVIHYTDAELWRENERS